MIFADTLKRAELFQFKPIRLHQLSFNSGRSTAARPQNTQLLSCSPHKVADHHNMEGLAPQAFASNNLDRSMIERREQAFLKTIFPDSLMLIVSDGKVLVYQGERKENTHLRWFRPFELQNLAYDMGDRGLSRDGGTLSAPISCPALCTKTPHVLHSTCTAHGCEGLRAVLICREVHACMTGSGACLCAAHLPAYLLGKDGPTWKLAVDVDADTLEEFLAEDYPEAQDLRALMPELPVAELAIAGHATALSQWHKACIHRPIVSYGPQHTSQPASCLRGLLSWSENDASSMAPLQPEASCVPPAPPRRTASAAGVAP